MKSTYSISLYFFRQSLTCFEHIVIGAILVLFAAAFTSPAHAAIRYVDNAATGANDGTSWANAWTSLGAIRGVQGGDTVYISGGATSKTYALQTWTPPSGSPDNWITYKVGQEPGHNGTIIFQGSSIRDNQFIFGQPGGACNWVIIDGEYQGQRRMTVQEWDAGGWGTAVNADGIVGSKFRYITFNAIFRANDSRKIEVDHCYWNPVNGIDRCLVGIGRNDNTGFGNNSIHDCTFNLFYQRGVNSQGGNGDDGIANLGSVDIYNNRFIGVLVSNFSGGQHQDGIQTDGNFFRIYNNYFENMSNYMIFGQGAGNDWYIYNNVMNYSDSTLTSQPTQGIAVGGDPGRSYTNHGYWNNTIRGANIGIAFGNPNGSTVANNVYIQNNLFYAGGGVILWGGGGNPTTGNNLSTSDPSYFANVANGNFHLTSNAIGAIDRANSSVASTVFTTDADGNARTGNWDIGAYEFSSSPAPSPTPTPSPSATPTPSPTPTPSAVGATPLPVPTTNPERTILADAVPATPDEGADASVELGIKFTSDVGGQIKGLRFYKSPANTGTHTGRVWTATGGSLGSLTFTNESGGGWQEERFTVPITIAPGTVYVASYHCSNGHYSDDTNAFANAGLDRPPLHVLQNGGVYRYGTTPAFPDLVWRASNYYVDIIFQPN